MTRADIIDFFKPLCNDVHPGIESFISMRSCNQVFERLEILDKNPISKVQLNQLLMLSKIPGVSDGFFKYYWLSNADHVYYVSKVEFFDEIYFSQLDIISIQHLAWGMKRLFIDCLYFFGSIHSGYAFLRNLSYEELITFYATKKINTELICSRGAPLDFQIINKDNRYLISEMACKTMGESSDCDGLKKHLLLRYNELKNAGRKKVSVKELFEVEGSGINRSENNQIQYTFLGDTIITDEKEYDEEIIISKCDEIASNFMKSREAAEINTSLYLSLVNDLDVYVATSMRNKKDFMDMANTCDDIFKSEKLKPLQLRYFDPTISAANGHEDKGLIECLMVKCCKLLVYSAGEKESYGKDAEAAMALSLGKPVIFYCLEETKRNFYRHVHPLSKLINFNTGVAVGAFVTCNINEVIELIYRYFYNDMQFKLEQIRPGYYRLIDQLTESVIRIQTDNDLLSNSFWSYYFSERK